MLNPPGRPEIDHHTMKLIVGDHLAGGSLSALDPRLTFHGEYASLVAFGISWLTASRMLPFITRNDERLSLLR